MRTYFVLPFCVLVAGVVSYPAKNGYRKEGGKSGVLVGGYYAERGALAGFPQFGPPGSMTAVVSGDAVATNTFSGAQAAPWAWRPRPAYEDDAEDDEEEISEQASKRNVVVEEVEESENPDIEEEEAEVPVVRKTTKSPKKTTKKKKPTKPPADVDSEEEEEQSWSRGPLPSFFFPVSISGPALARREGAGGGDWPGAGGPPIAIANAVSTGKGGVASSHATAFADPAAWAAIARGAAGGPAGRRNGGGGRD